MDFHPGVVFVLSRDRLTSPSGTLTRSFENAVAGWPNHVALEEPPIEVQAHEASVDHLSTLTDIVDLVRSKMAQRG